MSSFSEMLLFATRCARLEARLCSQIAYLPSSSSAPGPQAARTAHWPSANPQIGQNPRGRKMNVKPQVYQGSEAKGSPSRQPAPSPAPSTENTHHSKPRSSLAGVAGHRSRVGPEKQVMKFLVISMRSSKPSPDAPNIPARHHCRSFQSWFLLQLKA